MKSLSVLLRDLITDPPSMKDSFSDIEKRIINTWYFISFILKYIYAHSTLFHNINNWLTANESILKARFIHTMGLLKGLRSYILNPFII